MPPPSTHSCCCTAHGPLPQLLPASAAEQPQALAQHLHHSAQHETASWQPAAQGHLCLPHCAHILQHASAPPAPGLLWAGQRVAVRGSSASSSSSSCSSSASCPPPRALPSASPFSPALASAAANRAVSAPAQAWGLGLGGANPGAPPPVRPTVPAVKACKALARRVGSGGRVSSEAAPRLLGWEMAARVVEGRLLACSRGSREGSEAPCRVSHRAASRGREKAVGVPGSASTSRSSPSSVAERVLGFWGEVVLRVVAAVAAALVLALSLLPAWEASMEARALSEAGRGCAMDTTLCGTAAVGRAEAEAKALMEEFSARLLLVLLLLAEREEESAAGCAALEKVLLEVASMALPSPLPLPALPALASTTCSLPITLPAQPTTCPVRASTPGAPLRGLALPAPPSPPTPTLTPLAASPPPPPPPPRHPSSAALTMSYSLAHTTACACPLARCARLMLTVPRGSRLSPSHTSTCRSALHR